MIERSKQLFNSDMARRIVRSTSGLALSLGLALAAVPVGQTHTAIASPSPASRAQATATPATFPENGIYLYGQSPEPDQIGVAYAVMEVVGSQTVGAFYMPQSSFDCFYGEVQPDTLALNVVSSYEQDVYQYSLPLEAASTFAAAAPSGPIPMQLSGYHGIETVSSSDHQILDICRSVVQSAQAF